MGAPADAGRPAAAAAMQHADERQCMYAASWQAADAHSRARAARPVPHGARIGLSGRCGSGDPGNFLLVAPAAAGTVTGLDAGLARRAAELGPGPLRVALAARAAAGPAAAAARATALQVQVLQAVLSPGGSGGRGPGLPGRGGSPGSNPDVQLMTRGALLDAQPGCYGRSGALGGAAGSRAAEGAAAAALLRVAAAETPALTWRSTDVSPAAAAPSTGAGGDVYGRSLQVHALLHALFGLLQPALLAPTEIPGDTLLCLQHWCDHCCAGLMLAGAPAAAHAARRRRAHGGGGRTSLALGIHGARSDHRCACDARAQIITYAQHVCCRPPGLIRFCIVLERVLQTGLPSSACSVSCTDLVEVKCMPASWHERHAAYPAQGPLENCNQSAS